ncbi:coiled-coil domain-containing protein 22 homolog isoform X2 [Rhodamnia argentea]|uniref:Coiled-coil domain-containing protein 22 homolog isoform X2 n=1 Tax=Rhodamnia argentea TaxID=178133 RepID=A0A8B8QS54_9MYRT|nr:coiled-coil domain-containing protein 22 homolog isoform X2 [Rhodamnia argentea]
MESSTHNHKLLSSLRSFGVSIPDEVDAIKDLEPEGLVSICARCLNLVYRNPSRFPSSLPESVADKFRICREMASAVQNLGFIGDIGFHKFLYPSEEDMYELIRLLVGRLSESVVVGEANDVSYVDSKDKEEDWSRHAARDRIGKVYNDRERLNWWRAGDMLRELRLNAEGPKSSCATGTGSGNTTVNNMSWQEPIKESGLSNVNAFGITDNAADANDQLLEGNATARENQSSETRCSVEEVQLRERELMEEAKYGSSEVTDLEDELELLKGAAEMAFDKNHPTDFFLEKLNGQIDARKRNLLELELEWNALELTLKEKKRSLEESLYATKPEFQEKFQKLKEVELEVDSISSEMRKREEECSELSASLKKKPEQESRTSYIHRIKEITKNSRKQHADVERILKETRELQLESNSVQERLHRTYAVLDETVFRYNILILAIQLEGSALMFMCIIHVREAKKDQVGRQAYRLLTSIHESFEQIFEKILSANRVQREIAENEKKLAFMASRSLNIERLQADLDAIIKENERLEQCLEMN